jgi:peptidoglycan-N-acetylglucosamine deacetylase
MRSLAVALCVSALAAAASSAGAAECRGRSDALGTARVISVDPTEHPRVGVMQYDESLPLADKEVVLTFDDGPIPPYTGRILETLAAECVKATFFMVGRQAQAFPEWVRRVYNEGHTVASHSHNHPLYFTRLSTAAAEQEIDGGAASVAAALGDPKAMAPFFRFPGLGRSHVMESYVQARGLMTWSSDLVADDWTHISGQQVLARALERLERKGRGILLLHDIQPVTALMLPALLRELKARGYRIVHVVPAGPDRPKTVAPPDAWVMRHPKAVSWPRVVEADPAELPAPSAESFGWPRPFVAEVVARRAGPADLALLQSPVLAPPGPEPGGNDLAVANELPVPSGRSLGLPHPFGPRITLPPVVVAREPVLPVVAPEPVFAAMVAAAPWSGRNRALRPVTRVNFTGHVLGVGRPRVITPPPTPQPPRLAQRIVPPQDSSR